jgi:hypothetical protein
MQMPSNRNDSAPQGGEWQSNTGKKGESAAPSSRPAEEGLEGSILSGAQTQRGTDEQSPKQTSSKQSSPGKTTGAGAEATEGMNAASGRPEGGAAERDGSEPVSARKTEHKGSYGGEGGAPRTSSDEREPNERR